MRVLVGAYELAEVMPGGKFIISVDFHATYREYTVVVVDAPAGMAKLVVSSDDLCDNKRITIKEEECQLKADMEPRKYSSVSHSSEASPTVSGKMHLWFRSWM